MTPEEYEKEAYRDSIENIDIHKNREKFDRLGKYIFSDTVNLYQYKPTLLYQYQPTKISLKILNGTSSKQEKIGAIRKVKKYKNKKNIIKFTIQDTAIYLQGIYFDVEDIKLGLAINLDKEIFLIDLNSDGYKEILFYYDYNSGLETRKLAIWTYNKQKKHYYFTQSFWSVDYMEQLLIDKNTKTAFLRFFSYGCCSDYSDKLYEYKIVENNGKLEIQAQNSFAFSANYSLFPKKFNPPITTKLAYTSFIYSKPIIRDSKAPNVPYLFTKITRGSRYTYFIGEIPKGTTITELATYTNPKGEKWRFIVLEKGYEPEILINFEFFKKDYQIYAWLPPEKYDME